MPQWHAPSRLRNSLIYKDTVDDSGPTKMGELRSISVGRATILVETTDLTTETLIRAGTPLSKVDDNLQKIMDLMNPIARAFAASIERVDSQVNSASVEFGLGFTLEGNVFFVRAAGEATLKITLNWTRH